MSSNRSRPCLGLMPIVIFVFIFVFDFALSWFGLPPLKYRDMSLVLIPRTIKQTKRRKEGVLVYCSGSVLPREDETREDKNANVRPDKRREDKTRQGTTTDQTREERTKQNKAQRQRQDQRDITEATRKAVSTTDNSGIQRHR